MNEHEPPPEDDEGQPREGGRPGGELLRQVELLKASGEHAAAAAALWASGYAAEAGAIYEHIFEDARALKAYEDADDVASALRVALRANDAEGIDRVVTRSIHSGRADLLLQMLERDVRYAEVARVHTARGDQELAAEAYKAAGRFHDAALCLEKMGDLRGAGLLYERHLETDPTHPDACLRLGRILARFSRHDDAITLLQRAVQHASDPGEMRLAASPTLILSFTALGYDVAAEAVYERWRAAGEAKQQEVPSSFEAFLRSDSAAAFAAVVSRQRGEGTRERRATGLDAFFEDATDDVDVQEGPPDADLHGGGMLLAGRYLLGEPLGGGGVGQVFRAFDAFTDRAVAVKIFGSQAMQSEAVKAYAREARAASALGLPGIAVLVELNMPQGFVVTELVDGVSVEQRLREGGSAAWLRPFAHAVLDLLAACHRTGLVHGALKPTNVFLVPGGGVRVVDFGAHHLLALRSTETGGLSSVWPYLAPEQLFGAHADARADLYALAAMLYRALTGRPPFARAEDDRRRAPPRPSELVPALAGAWDALLLRALAPDAADRFPSARHMAEALPPVPDGAALPQAESLAGEAPAAVVLERADRYAKGPLAYEDRAGTTRVFEGRDLTVGRPVWIVDTEDAAALQALTACARITRGIQPVYDVLPESGRVVVARDPGARVAELAPLREVPQHLTRDLSSVAHALTSMHEQGLSLGGFSTERGRGPIGPRLRLAPAPVPMERSDDRVAEDWRSFVALVDEAFGMDPSLHTDPRRRLLMSLERARVLAKEDVDALAGANGESWAAFLDSVTEHLVAAARGRVMARLAASVLRG